MSVTVTENPTTYSLAHTLADYELHHSVELEDVPQNYSRQRVPERTGQNPPDWEVNYRRVPQYRPIDYQLDVAYRSVCQNNIERAFLWNMFTGIRLVTAVNRLWRATGGKVNDTYFRWAVGGEY